MDEKELQKEAALKEKEKQLQELREQIHDLQSVSSQSEKNQNAVVLEIRSELQQAQSERESKSLLNKILRLNRRLTCTLSTFGCVEQRIQTVVRDLRMIY